MVPKNFSGGIKIGLLESISKNQMYPIEQKKRKMTSSSNMRQGSVWTDKLLDTTNQEFKALGRKYPVLPNFWICCWEQRGLKVKVLSESKDSVFSLVSTMYSKLVDILRVQISICCKFFCTETNICPWKPTK